MCSKDLFVPTAARLRLTTNPPSLTIDDSGLLHVLDGTMFEIHCSGSGVLRWESSLGVDITVTTDSNPSYNLYQRSDPTNNEQTLFIRSFSSAEVAQYTCSTNLEVNGNTAHESVFITSGK